jgi:type I restriction enzyme M protein
MDTISLYKNRIDGLMDILFGAGVSNPQTIIEQLNYLLFLRALSIKDDEAELLGIADESEKIFSGELAKFRWQNLLALNAEDLYKALEESFEATQKKSSNPTVKLLFRNAHVKVFDKPTLRRALHEIEVFAKELDTIAHEGNKDVFGDMYEYLLSKLASAGTNGQFRTPRHIIEFMVQIVDPKKNQTVLDPACGTAGFLVAAYRYLAGEYTSEKMKKAGSPRAMDKLSTDEKSFLFSHMFTGFDSDEDMIKFGMMNLHLHGLTKSRLARQNSLTETSGMRDNFDVILANPPFSGKIDEESVSEEIRMGTKATELLFLRFMVDHLAAKGKMAVVVPEGVLFNVSRAYKNIRERLFENGLWCVVSLPQGVFNPYTDAKTSIIFLDKRLSNTKREILFGTVKDDGFDLGFTRKITTENDLPLMQAEIIAFRDSVKTPKVKTSSSNIAFVSSETIKKDSGTNLSLANYAQYEKEQILNLRLHGHNTARLGEILKRLDEKIKIKDDVNYKQVTVKMYGKGVIQRKILIGKEIKTKSQYTVRTGNFIISKIDARNGAFGVVPNELDGAIATQDFPNFEINQALVDPRYLMIITKHEEFMAICNSASRGTTNRKRLNVDFFLDQTIPLPSLSDQRKIIDEIEHLEAEAVSMEKMAEQKRLKIVERTNAIW